MTLFKDFDFGEDRRLQFRAGFFNLFNQAYPRSSGQAGDDINVYLDTECLVEVNGVPNGAGGTSDEVCDPTGGFRFVDLTQQEFGNIQSKRGRRVIELALKFYF